MNPEVLILTSLYDFSADLVVLQLKEQGVSVLRINKEQLNEYEIFVDPVQPSIEFRINGELIGTSKQLKSIWFRQPVFLRNTPPTPLPPDEQLKRSQWSAFLRGLSVLDHVAWMNWPQSTYLAESKPYQLLTARRSGLSVPKTIVSNDAHAIMDNFRENIIIKSLDTVLLRDKDDSLFTYTSICNMDDITPEAVKNAPVLAQEYIEPKMDYRVTVIGDSFSAVKILSDGYPISGDWRTVDKAKLEYVDCYLPKHIEESCKQLMNRLNLNFGAIDFVETTTGFMFLEINPTGEWGWLNSEERRLDIIVANWLARREG
ncbi:MAG: hypothetical protein AB2603_04520 [Candidatus Thiodiazotropha endolucinida]